MRIRRTASSLAATLLACAVMGQAAAASAGSKPRAAGHGQRAVVPATALKRDARLTTAAPPAPATVTPALVLRAPATGLPRAPGLAGMIVGIDPETGLLGPATLAQRLQLLPEDEVMLSRSSVGLIELPLPGGGVLVDLGGRFQEFSFVRVGPDGRFVFGCANDAATLKRGLLAPAPPAARLEER